MVSASGGVRSALSYTVHFCHDRAMGMEALVHHLRGTKLTPSPGKGYTARPGSATNHL
jgi:hypothetical protein